MRVLIVEDEVRLAMALQQILSEAGYKTYVVHDGMDAMDAALRKELNLIILDVMLPGRDGFAVAAELRRQRVFTPILMLTAKDTVSDKVLGLDSGADDYMTKPFDTDELLARVRALTRRQTTVAPVELSFGDVTYRAGNASLVCGSREIRLNYKEAEIIKLLMTYPQFLISKEEIISKVWGYNAETSDNNVEAYISFLRKKLHFVESQVSIIAIKKQGYKLEYHPC